jgi:hypothetical protein
MIVQFEADVEDGIIKIPKDVMDQLNIHKHLRVTVESEDALSKDDAAAVIESLINNPPEFDGPFPTRDALYPKV